jgi:SAM-dependent methyltransferase
MIRLKSFFGLFIKFNFTNVIYRIEKFVIGASKEYNKKGIIILDIGAGNTPYKKYFDKAQYFTQDIKQNKNKTIDYVADLNKGLKEISDKTFDCIICTQVLEHLKRPVLVYKEFHRILKPKGRVYLTTNFIYQIHMPPNDYYRFTKYGLKYLGESNGLIVKHLKPQGGIFQVLSYILTTLPIKILLKKINIFYYLYLVLFSIPIVLVNLTAYLLDFFDKDKQLTINYEVIYEKQLGKIKTETT